MATPREVALCDTVVRSGEALVLENLEEDIRFVHFPAVTDRNALTYIGVPLLGRESLIVGALFVIDSHPAASPAKASPASRSSPR